MKIKDELEEEIEEVMDSGKIDELTAVNDKIGVSEIRTEQYAGNYAGNHPLYGVPCRRGEVCLLQRLLCYPQMCVRKRFQYLRRL